MLTQTQLKTVRCTAFVSSWSWHFKKLVKKYCNWEGEGIDEVGKEKGTNITRVTLDPNYFGLTEMTVLVGDPKRAQEKLKWSPKTKFKELVKEMVAADISLITTAAS
ncbi:unnamed protein product [Adineta ricciae]|uniref:GDP-mannose 4,6-dehydratase n=1 Tax=Adineta ricciae TaxID=249248 RepID=A0A815AW28_ADIRI|nr:unnamed protein product [Adineta ricciae]